VPAHCGVAARRTGAAALVLIAVLVRGSGATSAAPATEGLFSLLTSDLTGPTSVSAGQGIWRSAAIRNTSGELRLTIALAGAGEHAGWVQPAVAQVELAPGQQQIVRFSVIPPPGASGTFDVALRASLIEARREAIIGETPVVTAEAREIVFSIDVSAAGTTASAAGAPTTAAVPQPKHERAGRADEALTGAPAIDAWRIVIGLLAIAVLLGLVRRTSTRRGARRRSAPRALPALAGVRRTQPDRLADLAAEQRALETMRERGGEATRRDRYEYDFGQARTRAEAKLRRTDEARRAASARLEEVRAAERALHRLADDRDRERVRSRTESARDHLEPRDSLTANRGAGTGTRTAQADAERAAIPVEAAADADDRSVPRPRRRVPGETARGHAGDETLDVTRLSQALESARARDGFDERPANLSSR
jgi:hypothetical protein